MGQWVSGWAGERAGEWVVPLYMWIDGAVDG